MSEVTEFSSSYLSALPRCSRLVAKCHGGARNVVARWALYEITIVGAETIADSRRGAHVTQLVKERLLKAAERVQHTWKPPATPSFCDDPGPTMPSEPAMSLSAWDRDLLR